MMERLQRLAVNMAIAGAITDVFEVDYGRHHFSNVLMLQPDRGCTLYMTTHPEDGSKPKTFGVEIDSSFREPRYLNPDDYRELASFLDLKGGNANNVFSPATFFRGFDQHIPVIPHRTANANEIVRVTNAANHVDDEKIYFVGWYRNPPGRVVRDVNYEKTKVLIGEELAKEYRARGISSCWSSCPCDESIKGIAPAIEENNGEILRVWRINIQ